VEGLSVGEDGASAHWSSSSWLASSAYTLLIARVLSVPRKIVLAPLAVGISQLNSVVKSYRTQ
jgi:hypothetical protein